MNPASGVYKSQGSVTFALNIEATFFVTDSLDLAETTLHFLGVISGHLPFFFLFVQHGEKRSSLVSTCCQDFVYLSSVRAVGICPR